MRRWLTCICAFGPILAVALVLTLRPPPAGSAAGLTADDRLNGRQIVRVYFNEPDDVVFVAAIGAIWAVDYDAGYLIIDVSPDDRALLEARGYKLEVDTALMAQYRFPAKSLPDQGGGIPGYACYRTVEETLQSAQDLAALFPQLVTLVDIGDSWEKTQDLANGYDLVVLKLTNKATAGPKPAAFLMSAIHAREYATAELNTRFAEYLLSNYGSDPDVTWLLDYHEIHLLLQSNPDGRKFAEAGDLWRKNTNENYCSPTSSNRGADLNRNFSFYWNSCGVANCSSGTPCNNTYRGPSAASEPEVAAIETYVPTIIADQRGPDITDAAPITSTGVFLDIHSSGGYVLWSWGFIYTEPPNADGLETLGRKLAFFNDYRPGQSSSTLYPTDGTTKDFAYGDLGAAAYVFEIGTSFFQSCSYFENTIVPENLPALLYLAKAARAPYMLPAGPEVTAQALSAPAVDAGAPVTLTVTLDDTRYNNANGGSEPVQNIASAMAYIDVPYWESKGAPAGLALTPLDGAWDEPIEQAFAVIDTTGMAPGRHLLFMHGQDAAGNWGVVSALFLGINGDGFFPLIWDS